MMPPCNEPEKLGGEQEFAARHGAPLLAARVDTGSCNIWWLCPYN
jgi:hypothetical protein